MKRHSTLTLILCVVVSSAFSPVTSFTHSSILFPPPFKHPFQSEASLTQRKKTFFQGQMNMMGQRGKRIKKEMKKEKQLETPSRVNTPYGPIRFSRPPSMCIICSGRGMVRCNVCEGRGVTRATGHRRRNLVLMERVIGSRWTAMEKREGHRQYRCSEMRGSKTNNNVELRLSNCCGPDEKRVHLWISLDELRNKSVWRAGWTTLKDIRRADEGVLRDTKVCFLCKGTRILKCLECGGEGEVGLYEPLHN